MHHVPRKPKCRQQAHHYPSMSLRFVHRLRQNCPSTRPRGTTPSKTPHILPSNSTNSRRIAFAAQTPPLLTKEYPPNVDEPVPNRRSDPNLKEKRPLHPQGCGNPKPPPRAYCLGSNAPNFHVPLSSRQVGPTPPRTKPVTAGLQYHLKDQERLPPVV